MRALLITEDLVEAAWKFTAAESAQARPRTAAIGDNKTIKLSFHRKLLMTISVCAVMFFCMLVIQFLLCDSQLGSNPRRRAIMEAVAPPRARAVHGMGMVFSRGRRGMTELIVAHMTEAATESELGLFLRTLYRSGALARADLVILFPVNSLSQSALLVIQNECDLGAKKLSSCFDGSSLCNVSVSNSVSSFNAAAFEQAEAGSVMGFEMAELDPDNVLDAFVEDPPSQLRRWVCYQLLLGILRHKYRTVLLARIGSVLILGDVLASLRKNNGSSATSTALLLLMESRSWDVPAAEFYPNATHDRTHHRRKLKVPPKSPPQPRRGHKAVVEAVYGARAWQALSGEERRKKLISGGIIAGTMRAARALSAAMVNEIIGVGLGDGSHHRHVAPREPFPDQVALSYMVHVGSVVARKVTGSVQLIDNGAMPTFAYSVAGTNRTVTEAVGCVAAVDGLHEARRYASVAEMVQRGICKSAEDAIVYPDCGQPSR